MTNNERFLNALVRRDSSQIQVLYQKCFPKVKKFVVQNRGNHADAEDIFQKALLQISVRYRREAFHIKSTFEAYLFTACKNLWRRELNKSKNKVTNPTQWEQVDDDTDIAYSIVEQKRWELFNDMLNMMSENCQKILNLFFAKLSYQSIVEHMGYQTELVARQRVFKCKTKLKSMIMEDKRFSLLKTI